MSAVLPPEWKGDSPGAYEIFSQAELALRERRLDRALELYCGAEASGYNADACAGARWLCHMLLGDFSSAWDESDAIEARGGPDPNRFWDGKSLEGRHVLVRCLHGLGDTLQYIRYAPLLRQRTASLTIEAQPQLKLLLQQSEIADQVITWGEPEPRWDAQIEIVELPRIFRSTVNTIPSHVPYVNALRPASGRLPSEPLRVGLVWGSSQYNPSRSIPLACFEKLCGTAHAEFFSLQADPDRGDLAVCGLSVQDCYDKSGSVLSAATSLSSMHLLITVDTMMAHLAGALAIPVWTLLPFVGDWRWMVNRNDSPWYPTMRLFRQPKEGDWASVLHQVEVELKLKTSSS